MLLHAPQLLAEPDVRIKRAVRRFRWFRRAFLEQVSALTQTCGIPYRVDTTQLADAFFEWSVTFESEKPENAADKRRYVDHISGVMLYNLLQSAPLSAPHRDPKSANPAAYWPEGFAYVVFCLNIRSAILAQDFGETSPAAPQMDSIRDWWTFRENVMADPQKAVGFFQHFAGLSPDWSTPPRFIPTAPQPVRGPANLRVAASGQGINATGAKTVLRRDLRLAVFDLDAISNSPALVETALARLFARHGLALPEGLADQPLAASLSHIALATGKICPSRNIDRFNADLDSLYRTALVLDPAALSCLTMLSVAGIEVRVALADDKAMHPEILSRLGLAGMATLLEGPLPEPTEALWISRKTGRLTAAEQQGFDSLGLGCAPTPNGQTIATLAAFPLVPL